MKKQPIPTCEDDLRPEYDASFFRGAERGKYAERYKKGTNLVFLEPDVFKAFPTAQAVNEALRLLMKVAKTSLAHSKNGR